MKMSLRDKVYDLCSRGISPAVKYLIRRCIYEFRKRVLRQRLIDIKVHDFRMNIDLNDPGISRTLMLFGTREKEHIYILKRELSPGNVVLDIGANIGYYVLMEAGIVGQSGYIYAMEPSPSNVDILKRNIFLNKLENQVEVFHMGASNKTGVERFYLSEMSNLGTFFPKRFFGEKNIGKDALTIDVKTISIPDFVAGRRPVDFMRMDIEGYEVEVFEGIIPMLKDSGFSPKILFETHRPKYDETSHSMRNALKEMFKYGYYPKIIVSNDHPKGEFLSRGYKPETLIFTDGYWRGIYYGVKSEDAIEFICDIGFVRAVLLERR